MQNQVREVFQNAQKLVKIPKCIRSLIKLYKENKPSFFDEFYRCVKLTLQSDCDIKCLVEFIIKFLTAILKEDGKLNESVEEANRSGCDDIGVELFGQESFETTMILSQSQSLVDNLLKNIILPYLNSVVVNVRSNACFFVKALFLEIDDVDNQVYDELKKRLLERIADKNATVRAMAAAALHRFQDIDNERDVVTSAYRFHLKNDPVYEVRLAVLIAMDPTKNTIKDIIAKTRDIKDIIRKAAYIKLSERIHVKSFSIEQRITILKNGLNDRNPNVRKVVETKLVDSWVKAFNNDIVELLLALDIQSDTQTTEKLITIILRHYLEQESDSGKNFLHVFVTEFRKQCLDTRKLLTKTPLTVERSFLWRCLVKFCKENDEEISTNVNKALPCDDEEASVVAEIDEMMAGIEVSRMEHNETSVKNESEQPSQGVSDISCRSSASDMFKGVPTSTQKDYDDLLDQIVPELPHFCNYINKFVTKIDKNEFSLEQLMDFEFMYNQLMEILLMFDIGDEAQRNIMEKLTLAMLSAESLSVKFNDFITPIMKCLATNVFPSSSMLLEFTAEATSKVYNTLAAIEESKSCQQNEILLSFDPVKQREYEMKYARVSVEIQELRDQLDEALKNQEYVVAQTLKEKISKLSEEKQEIQNELMNANAVPSSQQSQTQRTVTINLGEHPKELFKCLQIFCGCLEYGTFTDINDVIKTHVDKITIPGILSSEPRIRCTAVKALGICCLISTNMVTRYFALFYQILKRDVEKVQIMALQAIFDFLCQHGVRVLVNGISESANKDTLPVVDKSKTDAMSGINEDQEIPETPENTSDEENSEENVLKSLTKLLLDQLQSDSDDMKYVAVQGIAKLLLLGRLYSPDLLSKLIIQWYHPESTSEIKQFLGTFLPIYAFSEAKYGPNTNYQLSGQTALEECFMNTIEAIYVAKNTMDDSRRNSCIEADMDLAEVDLDNLIAFLVQLTSEELHAKLAISVCQKMLDILEIKSISKFNRLTELLLEYLPKVLVSLSLIEASKQQLKDLRLLTRKIVDALGKRWKVNDKPLRPVMKRIEKFTHRVSSSLEQVASQELMLNCSQGSLSADNILNATIIATDTVNSEATAEETTEPMDETITASAATVG